MTDEDFEALHQELADRLEHVQLLTSVGDSAEIGRQLHSIKGLAKAYGLDTFATRVHALEDHPGAFCDVRAMTNQLDDLYNMLEDISSAA